MKNIRLIDKTTWKFILVGIVNTIVGTGVMFAFYNLLHLSYWFSSASNYVIGSIVSYFLNKYFTFENKERSWKIVLKFIVNIAVCWFIAYGLAKPLALKLLASASETVRDNVAMCIGMCLFVGLNYLGQKFYAFKKSDETEEDK